MSDAPAKDPPTASAPPPAPAAGVPVPATSSAQLTQAAPAPAPAKSTAGTDVVLLGPPTADGAGVHVLRARDERLELGELRALEEGRPINGEIVTLAPRKDNPRVCDVKESYAPLAPHKGPAKVATTAYRAGWDEIFGKKPTTTPDRDLN